MAAQGEQNRRWEMVGFLFAASGVIGVIGGRNYGFATRLIRIFGQSSLGPHVYVKPGIRDFNGRVSLATMTNSPLLVLLCQVSFWVAHTSCFNDLSAAWARCPCHVARASRP